MNLQYKIWLNNFCSRGFWSEFPMFCSGFRGRFDDQCRSKWNHRVYFAIHKTFNHSRYIAPKHGKNIKSFHFEKCKARAFGSCAVYNTISYIILCLYFSNARPVSNGRIIITGIYIIYNTASILSTEGWGCPGVDTSLRARRQTARPAEHHCFYTYI